MIKKIIIFRSQDVAAMGVLSSKMKQKYEMGIKT